MDTFGDRLRSARNARGLTQDDVAEFVEVTKSAVSGWENNRETPSLDKLPRLRAVLKTSLDALVCGLPATDEQPDAKRGRVSTADARCDYSVAPEALQPEQKRLIDLFDLLNARKRRALLQLLGDKS